MLRYFIFCLWWISLCCYAQHDDGHEVNVIEEVIVTSSALQRSEADTVLPVTVLTEESLREKAASTLGDTLANEMGVTSASFGSGVGQPIIRGQSGNRVRVLQDSVGSFDASAVSGDHGSAVEPMTARQIEVVRGPATLLYGNGAIGGVVNIVDNRVPEQLPEQWAVGLEQRHNTVNDGNTSVAFADGAVSNVAWHVDAVSRRSEEVEIPGLAKTGAPGMTTRGYIANSQQDSSTWNVGASYIGDDRFIGAAFSHLENAYGLPPADAGEVIRLALDQDRWQLKGERRFDSFWQSVRAQLNYVDYQHQEIEVDSGATGTLFSNEGWEGRLTAVHAPLANWQGVVGLQRVDRTFSAIGEEAFIPEADIQSLGLFAVENYDNEAWTAEFGLRIEDESITPGACNVDHRTVSASAGGIWHWLSNTDVLLSASRSQRTPTVEELLSNVDLNTCAAKADPNTWVVHEATERLEIGNPDLQKETAQNIEFGLRKHDGNWRGELNAYYNRIGQFIYLADRAAGFNGIAVSDYVQNDAVFKGIEVETNRPFYVNQALHLDVSLFGDWVRAELDNGDNVPRIPPWRVGFEVGFIGNEWTLKWRATNVAAQHHTGNNESESAGYHLLSFYGDKHWELYNYQLIVFVKGNNLLDEEIRSHTSLTKEVAPEPGRGFEIGIRLLTE